MQADHIINLTPSMPARLLATALAPAPEAVLGFGLDHKGRPRVDGLWPAFLHAAELRQSNAPFNLADMFRMTGAPLLGGLSGRLLSQPGSGLLSELGTEARETARRLRISLVTLNDWVNRGRIRAHKIGGRVLFRDSDVEAALNQIVPIKSR